MKELKDFYYSCRDGDYYTLLINKDIQKIVNPFDPNSFVPILKAMDYPFIEHAWANLITHHTDDLYTVFGRYISRMSLCSYKALTYKDSEFLNKNYKIMLLRSKTV